MVWQVLDSGALHALVEAACPRVASDWGNASRECCLDLAPLGDVDELHKVLVTITDDDVFHRVGRQFTWPSSLPRRPVAFQPRPRDRDPVAKPLAGIGEVTVPAEWGGAVLVGVVGAEPVQVQRGELSDEFGVPMPERRHDGCWQTVGAPQPVHPAVEFDPFGLGVVGAEEVAYPHRQWNHPAPADITNLMAGMPALKYCRNITKCAFVVVKDHPHSLIRLQRHLAAYDRKRRI